MYGQGRQREGQVLLGHRHATASSCAAINLVMGVDGNCRRCFKHSHSLSDMVAHRYFDVFACFPCIFCTLPTVYLDIILNALRSL